MTTAQLLSLLATGSDIAKAIAALKGRAATDLSQPIGQTVGLTDYRQQYEVTQHNSVDKAKRPDKPIVDKDGNPVRYEKVNRLGLGLQELITERAVSFLFGSPVKIICDPQGDGQQTVLDALTRIYKDNKIDSINSEVALEMFRTTEVAECWFPVKKEKHSDYGFDTEFKLRVMIFSPWDGNELFPTFDETGDLIAFSRSFKAYDANGKEVTYFETYTAAEKIIWVQQGAGWAEESREVNAIGKIPIVYGKQKTVEWANVQSLIDRLEWLLSNYADTIDYHASPTIFVKGKIQGWADKGESGKIIEGSKDSEAEYLTWEQAPDMVKLEIETLIRFIYSLSQTPDISFEAVKGLGEISGVALQMLFLDAHLKVKKKQRVFDAYLERRTNIVKAFVGFMNTKPKGDASAITIDSQIQPFTVDDQQAMINRLTSANGGKPIMSQKTSIKLSGLVDDIDAEYTQIQEEETRAKTFDVTGPAF